jgi:hypothetical protein
MRLAQFVMISVGILFLISEGRPFPWQLVVILVLWFSFAAYLDSCIYGLPTKMGCTSDDTSSCSLFRGRR